MTPELAVGMTAADEANDDHVGGNAGSDANRRILHHDAFTWIDLHSVSDVQQ